MRSIFGGRVHHGSSHGLTAQEEEQAIEQAMLSCSQIMNDDLEAADAGLSSGDSPFHKMGKGVVAFLQATLGFEQDVMKEASEKLAEAEASAADHRRYATKKEGAFVSKIYPPGTEYALCLAQAQLMSAVVGLLNESLKESVMGFYKLRKAYITLDGILAAQVAYEKKHGPDGTGSSVASSASNSVTASRIPSAAASSTDVASSHPTTASSTSQTTKVDRDEDSEDDDFVDADETRNDTTPGEYLGHLELHAPNGADSKIIDRSGVDHTSTDDLTHATTNLTIQPPPDQPPIPLTSTSPIDIVILSGSAMCFGLLSLMISLIPPAFSRLLSIVGFRGDRTRGLSLLWQSTLYPNLYGGMGGLMLFGYYNVFVGFCDIVPVSGEGSYPRERLTTLLTKMRARYPNSRLWFLEEARMHSNNRDLPRAISLMESSPESPLRQLEALQSFEKALDYMYMHSYTPMATSFLRCVELNSWSPGLYYYAAASAHVQLYRLALSTAPRTPESETEARLHAKKTTEYFTLVPSLIGKKKLMARQLPFDAFISRKLSKWQSRASTQNIPLIDAIGVSPIEELIYFWNGQKRMRPSHLQDSLANLEWSAQQPGWESEEADEVAIYHLLRAATLRSLGRNTEAMSILKSEILSLDRNIVKGGYKDNWTPPCAHYEMGVNCWMLANNVIGGEVDTDERQRLLKECSEWIEACAAWEGYDLDARMGMRVTTARDTLRRLGFGTA